LVNRVLKFLGFEQEVLTLRVDSNVAKSIITRFGVGGVRHLECKCLWMQQLVQEKRLRVWKVPGAENIADIGTKVLTKLKLDQLCELANIREAPGVLPTEIKTTVKSRANSVGAINKVRKVSHSGQPRSVDVCERSVAQMITILVAAIMTQFQGANAYSDEYEDSEIVVQCAASSEIEVVTAVSPAVSIMIITIVLLGVAVRWLMSSNATLAERVSQLEKVNAEGCEFENKDSQTELEKRRSVCIQSMCTYSRKLTQPRFVVLAERETEPFIGKCFWRESTESRA
jgi:hypothetical protein